jgi:hypothetical protein
MAYLGNINISSGNMERIESARRFCERYLPMIGYRIRQTLFYATPQSIGYRLEFLGLIPKGCGGYAKRHPAFSDQPRTHRSVTGELQNTINAILDM